MAACPIPAGIALDCYDGKGGIETAYVAVVGDLATFTANTSGTITAMTLSSGKQFFTFALDKENATLNSTLTNSQENGSFFYAQELSFTVKKMTVDKRYTLKLLAQNRLMIIVKDNNGKYWLMGKTGAILATSADTTGKAYGDLNGYTLTFNSNEPDDIYEVTSSLIATLTVPA